jgi:hypothetical protein
MTGFIVDIVTSLVDASVNSLFRAIGIQLTSTVVSPAGGFPRLHKSTDFNPN